jgi:hypothetical protein
MSSSTPPNPTLHLFGLSFLALFLELMMIRWVPSMVHLVAYYANLMLISSFLGLGLGAMLANARVRLYSWFPALLTVNIGYLILCQFVSLPATSTETRFFGGGTTLVSYVLLVGVFLCNSAMFLPLGQRIGWLFNMIPPLRAYKWDLSGSLCGTIAFGIFSYAYFSPAIGVVITAALFIMLSPDEKLTRTAPLLAVACGAMLLASAGVAVWSPYYYVTVHRATPDGGEEPVASRPAPDIRQRSNPPLYVVKVNGDFYQMHGTIDLARYDGADRSRDLIAHLRDQYLLPYALKPAPARVLVLGSGGGMDVEAALLAGAERVDAVDIDPVLIDLARAYSAADVYGSSRVSVHVDDARAYLQRAQRSYDLVVFGFLDSQALSSYMSSLRLDGYTYTVEGLRRAYELLKPGGMMAVSFAAAQPWLGPKLHDMLRQATGRQPVAYADGPQVILCVSTDALPQVPPRIGRFRAATFSEGPVAATDDWPYLYLHRRTVPADYVVVIGLLLTLSAYAVHRVRGRSLAWGDGHFLLLGVGFLLLETKSIADCSLYFGSTWLVTMVVVAGVLIMVLAANAVAVRLKHALLWLYLPLFASLALLSAVPRSFVLGFPFVGRLGWTMLLVPLPLFFAGLIFSVTFREESGRPGTTSAALFGANLLGATIGGFCEYLGMATGSRWLMLLVFGAYAGSMMCLALSRHGVRHALAAEPQAG